MRPLGMLLLLGGLMALLCFLKMDTSVPVPSFGLDGFPTRVHNIGLLSERQNGLIISGLASFAGLAIVLWGRNNSHD